MATNEESSGSNGEEYIRVKKSQILYQDLSVALVRPQPQHSSSSARDQLLRSVDEHLIYLYETQKLCDLVITNGDKKFHLHRVVLAAQSPKYRQVFSDTSSPLPSEIAVAQVSTPVLASVLKYLYTGEITLTEGNVAEVMNLGFQLDLQSLLDSGRQLLLKFNEQNVLKYLLLAQRHNFQDLKSQLTAFARRHFAEVSASPDFLKLATEGVVDVLSGEEARQGVGEVGVLRAAMRWIQATEEAQRSGNAIAVLKCVKFERVAPQDLMEIVEKNSTLADVPEISFMLYEAYKHHALKGDDGE